MDVWREREREREKGSESVCLNMCPYMCVYAQSRKCFKSQVFVNKLYCFD